MPRENSNKNNNVLVSQMSSKINFILLTVVVFVVGIVSFLFSSSVTFLQAFQ